MGAETNTPVPPPTPDSKGPEKALPKVEKKAGPEPLNKPAEAPQQVEQRRAQCNEQATHQENQQEDLLTRCAKITAENMTPKLYAELKLVHNNLDGVTFQDLKPEVWRALRSTDAVIRGMVAQKDIHPDEVDGIAPRDQDALRHFIDLVFQSMTPDMIAKMSAAPKGPTLTTEPKGPTLAGGLSSSPPLVPNGSKAPDSKEITTKITALPKDIEESIQAVVTKIKNSKGINPKDANLAGVIISLQTYYKKTTVARAMVVKSFNEACIKQKIAWGAVEVEGRLLFKEAPSSTQPKSMKEPAITEPTLDLARNG